MIRLTKEKYFRFVIAMQMVMTFLLVVKYRLPAYLGSPHVWALVWGISLLLFKPKVFTQKLMLMVGLYGVFLLLMLNVFWIAMDDWNVKLLWNEFYQIAVGISIISYFYVSEDYIGLAKITKYTLIFLFITAVMTNITASIDPMYARYIFIESLEGESSRHLIDKFGAGNYGTVIAYMAIIPLLIYYFKNNNLIQQKKWGVALLISLFFITIFRMQIFTNIIVAVVLAIISWLSVKNREKTYIALGILAIIVMVIPTEAYVDTFYILSEKFSNMEDVSFKFKEVGSYLEYGEETVGHGNAFTGRADRFPILADTFSKSPIFGCFFLTDSSGYGYLQECGHLYWMNKLTVTGIVGFLFFVSILVMFLQQEKKKFEDEFRNYFMLAILSIIIYGLFKNVVNRECWYLFFVIIPGMYYLPLLNKRENATTCIKQNE